MSYLAYFMESLTQEQDKLVQMGLINPTKYQALASGDLKQANGKRNPKYLKHHERKKDKYNPKCSHGYSNPRKE